MAGRIDVDPSRTSDRERERMVDAACGHLVVAGEPGQDRKSRGIRRRPAGRPEGVRPQVPDRARARRPGWMEVEELVERARVAVDDEGRAVAVGSWAALDGHVGGDRIRPRVGVEEVHEGRWVACRPPPCKGCRSARPPRARSRSRRAAAGTTRSCGRSWPSSCAGAGGSPVGSRRSTPGRQGSRAPRAATPPARQERGRRPPRRRGRASFSSCRRAGDAGQSLSWSSGASASQRAISQPLLRLNCAWTRCPSRMPETVAVSGPP
jgi:hypothetical protein